MLLAQQLLHFGRNHLRSAPQARRQSAPRQPLFLSLDSLEERIQPSAAVDLGAASQFAVLGLDSTRIFDNNATIGGNIGVSEGGSLRISSDSTISGSVDAFSTSQVLGSSNVVTDPALLQQAGADALAASSAAAALTPTQTFRTISRDTTIVGNGGLNVIQINGNIDASITLVGSASDIFVINVKGGLHLKGNASLSLSGGVTADNVIYNFTGRGEIEARAGSSISGTLLAPNYNVAIRGTVSGAIIVGGSEFELEHGATINQVSFTGQGAPVTPPGPSAGATLSGHIFDDLNNDGVFEPDQGETGFADIMVTLSGTDLNGNSVTLITFTDSTGAYTFTDIPPGTYSLSTDTPSGFNLGGGTVGTVDGVQDGTAASGFLFIDQISLASGDQATGYDFGMVSLPNA